MKVCCCILAGTKACENCGNNNVQEYYEGYKWSNPWFKIEEPKEKIDCAFYLVLSPDAASDIRKACKNILEELEKGNPRSSI